MLTAANCESQIDDHDPTVPILVDRLGFVGRFREIDRQLETWLLRCVRLPPLCFLTPANLLDDERG
jgi:hypothetical protein